MANEPRNLVRFQRALEITGLKRSAFYDKVKAEIIPRPIRIDPNGKAVAWIEADSLRSKIAPSRLETKPSPRQNRNPERGRSRLGVKSYYSGSRQDLI